MSGLMKRWLPDIKNGCPTKEAASRQITCRSCRNIVNVSGGGFRPDATFVHYRSDKPEGPTAANEPLTK
jgi:hypothetical protein